MPIIGENNVGTFSGASTAQNFGTVQATFTYVASAGDQVTELWWYGARAASFPFTRIEIAIYTIAAGLPNTLVGSPSAFSLTSSTLQWWSITGIAPITLTAGVEYCVAWSPTTTNYTNRFFIAANATSLDATLGLPATWTHTGFQARRHPCYAVVVNVPPVNILYPCCAQLIA